MNGTTDAQGDAMRTQGSFANQMRALKSDVRDLGESFGSALVPVLKEIIPVVRNALQSFLDWGNSGAFASIDDGFRQVKDAFGVIWDEVKRFAAMLEPAKQALISTFGSVKGIIDDFRRGVSDTTVDMSYLSDIINIVAIVIGKVFGIIDKLNIGELLGKGISIAIETMTEFYNTIMDKFIGGLNLAIEAYNKLVPLMQKAGMDVQEANKISFEGMTATVEEEMQKQADAVSTGTQDIHNAVGGGSGGNTSSEASTGGSIPSWAGDSEYIREQLAATGGKSIDDLIGITSVSPGSNSGGTAAAAPAVVQNLLTEKVFETYLMKSIQTTEKSNVTLNQMLSELKEIKRKVGRQSSGFAGLISDDRNSIDAGV